MPRKIRGKRKSRTSSKTEESKPKPKPKPRKRTKSKAKKPLVEEEEEEEENVIVAPEPEPEPLPLKVSPPPSPAVKIESKTTPPEKSSEEILQEFLLENPVQLLYASDHDPENTTLYTKDNLPFQKHPPLQLEQLVKQFPIDFQLAQCSVVEETEGTSPPQTTESTHKPLFIQKTLANSYLKSHQDIPNPPIFQTIAVPRPGDDIPSSGRPLWNIIQRRTLSTEYHP